MQLLNTGTEYFNYSTPAPNSGTEFLRPAVRVDFGSLL